MNKIMTANFQGAEILGVQFDGAVFVVLKPLVEAMGLAWNAKLEQISVMCPLRRYAYHEHTFPPGWRPGDCDLAPGPPSRLAFHRILLVSAMKSGSGSRPSAGMLRRSL